MENTVTIKLEDFLRLHDENNHMKAGNEALLNSCKTKDRTIIRMKRLLLEQNVDKYNIENIDIEKLIDINNWTCGIKDAPQLIAVGIKEEEIVAYIKELKAQFEAEEEPKDER